MMLSPLRRGRASVLWLLALASLGVLAGLAGLLALDVPAWFAPRSGSGKLVVFCAAGLKPPLTSLARRYQRLTGVEVQIQYGGSNTLLSTLQVAPQADLFIPADASYVAQAHGKKLIAEVVPLATMRPVLAVRQGNPNGYAGLSDLMSRKGRISHANPEAAAVGKVARDALLSAGLWEAFSRRIVVFKPTVNDVAADIQLGSADAGFVWDVTVRNVAGLEAIAAPPVEGLAASLSACVAKSCTQPAAALRFARYLASGDEGGPVFLKEGYAPVGGDPWTPTPELRLRAAAMLRPPLAKTLAAFEAREGAKVVLVAGMPADAFLACDRESLAQAGDRFGPASPLSSDRLALLVPKGNPRRLRALARPGHARPARRHRPAGVPPGRADAPRPPGGRLGGRGHAQRQGPDPPRWPARRAGACRRARRRRGLRQRRRRPRRQAAGPPPGCPGRPVVRHRYRVAAQGSGGPAARSAPRGRVETALRGSRLRLEGGRPAMTAPPRVPSDLPFLATALVLGGSYVVLILAMLAADASFTSPAHLLEAMRSREILYSVYLSLASCTMSAILSLWVAVPLGYLMSRHEFMGKALLDALLDIPIVLPPLVVGLSLLILFQTPPGRAIDRLLPVTYAVPGVILAQFSVAAAFAVRTMRVAFDAIPQRREQVALTLGCSRGQAFWRVVLPEAWPGMVAAFTLAWTRALGEFGPILVFAGTTRMKTEVLSSTVFLELSVGNLYGAVAVSLLMVAVAALVLIAVRLAGLRQHGGPGR